MDFNSGGKKVIERLVDAYRFITRQALCGHLDVAKNTIAKRCLSDIFPEEWVLQCAIKRGNPVEWLSFGVGHREEIEKIDTQILLKKILINGKLTDNSLYLFDSIFLQSYINKVAVIYSKNSDFICKMEFEDVRDGKWLVNINSEASFGMLTRPPISRICIASKTTIYNVLSTLLFL